MDGSAVPAVQMRHFADALQVVQPSVSAKDHRSYERLRKTLRCVRSRITDTAAPPDELPAASPDGEAPMEL